MSARRSLLGLVLGALCLALAAPAAAAPLRAGFESGNLREVDEISTLEGEISVTAGASFSGRNSARFRYAGGGENGYARAVFDINWAPDDRVNYTAAFKLPENFYEHQQGQVALMRWDNWPSYHGSADAGGIVIFGSDRMARLVRARYNGEQEVLGRPFKLPAGRWFRLSVRQRLNPANPFSTVILNGRRVIRTAEPNSYGRPINRLRYGIVAISAGNQLQPLALRVDDIRFRHR